jgi:hypothetical protein
LRKPPMSVWQPGTHRSAEKNAQTPAFRVTWR